MLKGNKSLNFSTIDTNEFKEYFCSLLNPDDIFYEADDDVKHFLLNYSDEEVVRIFDIMNVNISMEELEKAISQLKNGKSGREDFLLNELFIHGNHAMMKFVCEIFNVIFQSGIFPEPWSDRLLVPLFKKGNINFSTKCLLCYMQTMLSCYRIRVPGYRKRWMLCKIIQIVGS